MPDFSAMTALDVAIGLFFLFFLLSIVCSTVNELLASAFGWRARNLELAIRHLLVDPSSVEEFWNHPRIRSLGQPVKRRLVHRWTDAEERERRRAARDDATTVVVDETIGKTAVESGEPTGAEGIAAGAPVDEQPPPPIRKPSYIATRAFALTALDTLAPELASRARQEDAKAGPSRDVIEQLRKLAGAIPNDGLRTAIHDALDEGRTHIDDLRASVEAHFDATMDRASGWYKRRTQLALLCIAAAVTVIGNVDTVQVASKLWKDDALRGSVVQQATAAPAEAEQPPTEAELDQLADDVDRVGELGLPVGWNEAGTPDTVIGWIGKLLLGWPLTIVALSMGSAFWFDVLGKVARVRVAGKPDGTVIDDSGRKPPA